MSFTYTTLQQAIQDYTDNTETTFVNNINTFIQNAEERILKFVDLDFFRKNATATTVSGNKYLALPVDYLSTFSVALSSTTVEKTFLLNKDVNFVQEYWPDATQTGTPKYYSTFDTTNMILAPTPNANYDVELHYFYRPTSIVTAAGGETWLGTNAPNTLLYACLTEAYIFMKGEQDLITLYETRFTESAQRLKVYGAAQENSDAYREGLFRLPKS